MHLGPGPFDFSYFEPFPASVYSGIIGPCRAFFLEIINFFYRFSVIFFPSLRGLGDFINLFLVDLGHCNLWYLLALKVP